jgi:endonuclease/exonuclease/phosphatase family metal-dependent hydrolase
VTCLLSWNVAGRVREGQQRQAEAVLGLGADVICLQEITPTSRGPWHDALTGAGFDVAISEHPPKPTGSRRLAVLIAAKDGIDAAGSLPLPWPERHLAAVVGGRLEVHNLHAPLSQKADRVKVRTLEAVFAAVARDDAAPRVVCGDFNTPRYESREGEISTFARTMSGNIRPDYGEEHDRAELRLIADLPARGWRDAFRALHGYERRDRSWKSFGPGYRLDHIVVSPAVEVEACDYVHEWREERMSDHSAIWARLSVAA